MKDVAVHTRIAPQGRQQTLTGFVQQMNRNEQVRKEMSGWGLRFGDNLLNVNARIMPQEKIFQANNQMVCYSTCWLNLMLDIDLTNKEISIRYM